MDQAGVRTTTDLFKVVYFEAAISTFMMHNEGKGPREGEDANKIRLKRLRDDVNFKEKQDVFEWTLGPIRVRYLKESKEITVTRDDGASGRVDVRLSATTAKANLTTSVVKVTASNKHIYVCRQHNLAGRQKTQQKMHSDMTKKFEVRAFGYSVGFNAEGRFTYF